MSISEWRDAISTTSREELSFTEPKLVAAAIAAGGRLVRVEDHRGDGRLTFVLSGLPASFTTQIVNDEVRISARAMITAMETVLGLISERRRARR